MSRKKIKKEEIKEEIEVIEIDGIGKVLPITADKDNPVSDGLEFAGGEENE